MAGPGGSGQPRACHPGQAVHLLRPGQGQRGGTGLQQGQGRGGAVEGQGGAAPAGTARVRVLGEKRTQSIGLGRLWDKGLLWWLQSERSQNSEKGGRVLSP